MTLPRDCNVCAEVDSWHTAGYLVTIPYIPILLGLWLYPTKFMPWIKFITPMDVIYPWDHCGLVHDLVVYIQWPCAVNSVSAEMQAKKPWNSNMLEYLEFVTVSHCSMPWVFFFVFESYCEICTSDLPKPPASRGRLLQHFLIAHLVFFCIFTVIYFNFWLLAYWTLSRQLISNPWQRWHF